MGIKFRLPARIRSSEKCANKVFGTILHSNASNSKKLLRIFRIFQSGQALAFADIMRKVKPQQEIKRIRDRITVHKIQQTDGKLLSVS